MAGAMWGIFVLVPFLLLVSAVIYHVPGYISETWAKSSAYNEWVKNGRPPEGWTATRHKSS